MHEDVQKGARRIVLFPPDVSLGLLRRWGPEDQEWPSLGEAQGEVHVGAEDLLELTWDYYLFALTPLGDLAPEALYGLRFPKSWYGDQDTLPALTHLTGLRELHFDEPAFYLPAANAWHLRQLTALRVLNVGKMELTDEALGFLAALPDLEVLHLMENAEITGSGLAALASRERLRLLDLERTNLLDESLAHLQGFPALEELWLLVTPITGSGLRYLRDCQALRTLDLSTTGITDASLEPLVALPHLQRLDLNETGVGDEGIALFQESTSLQELFLDRMLITDRGLRSLERLTTLRLLSLSDTRVTDAGVAALQEALPACEIIRRI